MLSNTPKAKQRKAYSLWKTNVLTYAFDLWERTFYEIAADYPDVKTDYAHVDATTMWMVKIQSGLTLSSLIICLVTSLLISVQ